MPTRRGDARTAGLLLLVAAAISGVLVAARGSGAGPASPAVVAPSSWAGLAGGARPRVSVGQRVLVVLRAPSLADRVAGAGGIASDVQERAWTRQAQATQKVLTARLALQGVGLRPEYTYTRVLNAFSAAVDSRGIAVLERAPEVAGVYPVRAAFPASASTEQLQGGDFESAAGGLRLAGFDGRGVTIALLDTGVDRAQPFLRGRILAGFDVVGRDPSTGAARKPGDPGQVEEHGTEMAGILVGAGGPGGLAGVATGASLIPIRVAGWQPDASGRWSIYGRTDEIIAGLEKAVDPNGDGDAHDAARIALVPLAEPYSSFPDDPLARAAAGALKLDTLVVAPAGNDGAAGPGFGSISAPGGAAAALTVGAADLRARSQSVRVVVRSGLRVLLDGDVPLAGAEASGRSVSAHIAVPRTSTQGLGLADFFDARGYSLVAGRAALVPAGSDPRAAAEFAARAGATAVLLYGGSVPSGAFGVDEALGVPVVGVPVRVARSLRASVGSRGGAAVTIGAPAGAENAGGEHVAPFSSTGLTFDGTVKPDLVGPGIGLATSAPGGNPDGSARFATVNGSSAGAAVVAGAAALLAEARPSLDAAALKSLLVGTAAPLAGDPVAAQGGGLVDVGAAVAAELGFSPATLSLGVSTGLGWRATQTVTLRNLSTRRLRVRLSVQHVSEGAAAVRVAVRPGAIDLPEGLSAKVTVTATVASAPVGDGPAAGVVVAAVGPGSAVRIPWVVAFGPQTGPLLARVRLSAHSFKPSDAAPALLSFQAGRVTGGRIVPVARLDVRLSGPNGFVGLLARIRDVLPGSYAFGLTGRGPVGEILGPGMYTARLVAYPTAGGSPSVQAVRFTIR